GPPREPNRQIHYQPHPHPCPPSPVGRTRYHIGTTGRKPHHIHPPVTHNIDFRNTKRSGDTGTQGTSPHYQPPNLNRGLHRRLTLGNKSRSRYLHLRQWTEHQTGDSYWRAGRSL